MSSLTDFQKSAVDKIKHIGGSIYYASDRKWTDSHGARVHVPAADFKTEGFIGFPTITALVDAQLLYWIGGNEYALAGKARAA